MGHGDLHPVWLSGVPWATARCHISSCRAQQWELQVSDEAVPPPKQVLGVVFRCGCAHRGSTMKPAGQRAATC